MKTNLLKTVRILGLFLYALTQSINVYAGDIPSGVKIQRQDVGIYAVNLTIPPVTGEKLIPLLKKGIWGKVPGHDEEGWGHFVTFDGPYEDGSYAWRQLIVYLRNDGSADLLPYEGLGSLSHTSLHVIEADLASVKLVPSIQGLIMKVGGVYRCGNYDSDPPSLDSSVTWESIPKGDDDANPCSLKHQADGTAWKVADGTAWKDPVSGPMSFVLDSDGSKFQMTPLNPASWFSNKWLMVSTPRDVFENGGRPQATKFADEDWKEKWGFSLINNRH